MDQVIERLWQAWIAADAVWSEELRRQFGRDAGDIRYTGRGRGLEGSELRRLHDEFRRTGDEWRAAVDRA